MLKDSSSFIPYNATTVKNSTVYTTYCQLSRQQLADGKVIMVKRLRPEYLDNEKLRSCLAKEYEIGRRVSAKTHYVVKYNNFVSNDEEVELIMDFVDGDTLDKFVEEHPDYFRNKANLCRFLLQLLEGIRAIHHANAVHLDIKPSNLMMTHVNRDVCIIDLGFCHADSWPGLLGTTADFAAPELLAHNYDIDARTDIYAIGKILLYIEHQLQVTFRGYRLPKDLKGFVQRCIRQNKQERWNSVDEALGFMDSSRKKLVKWRIAAVTASTALLVLTVLFCLRNISEDPKLFVGENNIVYEVLSEDSAICQVVGSDSTQIFKHIYIRSSVSHNNKQYTVTGIADNAFKYNNLESLSLPQTLQTIGNNAFLGCQKLQFVDIPDCVTTIGSQSFWLCRSMSSLRLPSGIKEIPSGAFSFTNMENVVVPEGVTTIGCDAFAANERLVNVSLPKSLQSLERGVFWKCKALKTITIPENVREIGVLAFYDCTSLADIYNLSPVPQNVSKIFSPDMHVTVHVPRGSAELYRKHYVWKSTTIVEKTY